MKIKSVDMFHTPTDWPALERWLASLPKDGTGTVATTAAMMAWNLAAKITNTTEEEEA